jgi:4-hydroxybenzoate polyprenyltransferase
VDRRLLQAMRPYTRLARLDRPVGVWLKLFPCWAALFQAAHGLPGIRDFLVFTLGAFLMRSAGSTLNDIADRNYDGHVERTRFRPLANGEIGLPPAVLFMIVQLALAASLLVFLTPDTRLLTVCVVPLVILYPFCKRFTHWPQAVLGAAFNWGMLMAWAQVAGHVPLGAALMWAGASVILPSRNCSLIERMPVPENYKKKLSLSWSEPDRASERPFWVFLHLVSVSSRNLTEALDSVEDDVRHRR